MKIAMLGLVLILTACTDLSDTGGMQVNMLEGWNHRLALRQEQVQPPALFSPMVVAAGYSGSGSNITYNQVRRSLLIRNGSMRVLVDSVEAAMERIEQISTATGSMIASSSTMGAEGMSAVIELRVPPEALERAMAGIRRLGQVQFSQVAVEDIGDQYVDVQARLNNGRRLEARLLQLLATRTGRLTDVLEVEQQLSRVREATDALEGRRRYLEEQMTRSSLRVELFEADAVFAASPGSLRQSLAAARRNLFWFVALLIQASGVIIPLGILATIVWRLRRKTRPATSAA